MRTVMVIIMTLSFLGCGGSSGSTDGGSSGRLALGAKCWLDSDCQSDMCSIGDLSAYGTHVCVAQCLTYATCGSQEICYVKGCARAPVEFTCCQCLETSPATIQKGSKYKGVQECAELMGTGETITYPSLAFTACGSGQTGQPCAKLSGK